VWFFWVPFFVLSLYLAAWKQLGSRALKFHPVSEG
jgi:hypothetical protein